MRPWHADEIASLLNNSCNRLYVAHEDDFKNASLKAFLLVTFVAGEAEILAIAVDPHHQRCGVASQIMKRMIQDCEQAGIGHIMLEVAETNKAAQSLYHTLTFVKVGYRLQYYTFDGIEVDAYILKRQIEPVTK